MHHVVVPTGLQYVQEAYQVALQIGIWVGDAIADTCLGSQVHNLVELFTFEQLVNTFLVVYGQTDEPAAFKLLALHFLPERQVVAFNHKAALLHATIFQSNVVVVVDVIDAYHLIAAFGKHVSQFRANETGCSCN